MKRWKKGCAITIAAAMLFSLGACGDSNKTEKTTQGKTKQNNAAMKKLDFSRLDTSGSYPKLKEKEKLTVLVGKDTNIKDMETNAYINKLEKAVNVDLSFKYLPAGPDGKQKLSVMLSSGSKLPDMMFFNLSAIEAYTYGAQGYFLPINKFIEKESKYLKAYLETKEGKNNLKYLKSPDGNIYSYPGITEELPSDYDHRIWINKTWLDKLGLKKPTTTDEYYDVLKAFKEKDPNGNGKADEIPLIGDKNGWNQSVWSTLMYAFLYVNDMFDYLIVDKDGKLDVSYTQPEWKEGLKYMHKLCKDGLLSPLTFTQDYTQLQQILGDPSGQLVGSLCAGSMSLYTPCPDRKKDMTHMAPLTGPEGVCWTSYRNLSLPFYTGYITKDCKDPVAAAAVFDYMYSEDMSMQARWGTEGKSWEKAKPGEAGMFENLGYKATFKVTKNIWQSVQNEFLNEIHPTLRTYEMTSGQVMPDDPYDAQRMSAEAMPDYINKKPDKIVYRLIYTKEEADEIAEILTSLGTHRDEATAAFITGTRSFSDWDNYVKELDSIGLQKFIKVAQKAYDRMEK